MKKTLKTLTAAFLAFIIALGSFSVFAAEEKDPITRYNEEYVFAGNLTEGKNTVELPSGNPLYCTFNAENEGYYTVTYNWREIEHFFIPVEDENGFTDEIIEMQYLETDDDYDTDSYLVYLEEGEYFLMSYIGYYTEPGDPANVEITYYGSSVRDISFEGGTEYYLVWYWNIEGYYDEEDKYPENTYSFDSGKTEITFDTGKKLQTSYFYLICSSEKEIENGEYDVTVYFLNEAFEKTISVYPISKQITKVEVENLEDYTDVSIAYSGEILYDFKDMELTVTYADGFTKTLTVESGEWFEVDLHNGNPYTFPIDYYYDNIGGTVYFYVSIGGEPFIEKECTTHEATDRENRQHLNYKIYYIFYNAASDIRYAFEEIRWANSLWDAVVCLRRAVFETADEIFTAFEESAEEFFSYLKNRK